MTHETEALSIIPRGRSWLFTTPTLPGNYIVCMQACYSIKPAEAEVSAIEYSVLCIIAGGNGPFD
jgi:hypothetical protein